MPWWWLQGHKGKMIMTRRWQICVENTRALGSPWSQSAQSKDHRPLVFLHHLSDADGQDGDDNAYDGYCLFVGLPNRSTPPSNEERLLKALWCENVRRPWCKGRGRWGEWRGRGREKGERGGERTSQDPRDPLQGEMCWNTKYKFQKYKKKEGGNGRAARTFREGF